MKYNSGKERCACCGMCVHFLADGYTVGEIDGRYRNNIYARVVVGRCALLAHEFDPFGELDGADHYRWETHISCLDFEEFK